MAPQALKPVALTGADIDAGKPHVAVAMKGNTSVRNTDPHNLIAVTLDGIKAQHFGEQESMQEMPGFAGKLSDKEVTDLVNFLRASWGGLSAKVSEAQVRAIREEGGAHH